jgi:hypothetical protein
LYIFLSFRRTILSFIEIIENTFVYFFTLQSYCFCIHGYLISKLLVSIFFFMVGFIVYNFFNQISCSVHMYPLPFNLWNDILTYMLWFVNFYHIVKTQQNISWSFIGPLFPCIFLLKQPTILSCFVLIITMIKKISFVIYWF